MLSILITVVYFLPIALVTWRAWSDATQSEKAAHKGAISRFYDMLFYIMLRSAMGLGGFVLTSLIHVQLYCLVFVMMWCASHIKEIADKVATLKEQQAGTYKGLELRGSDEIGEKKPQSGAALKTAEIVMAED